RREVEPGPARAADSLDRRLRRPRLGWARDTRALERRQPPDHDLLRDEDRPGLVRAAERARRAAVRRGCARLEIPGAAGADAQPLLAELRNIRALARQAAAEQLEVGERCAVGGVRQRPFADTADCGRAVH